MLGAGLAAVGEAADVSVVTVSTEAGPAWGEEREEDPGEAPPMLFCRGERGLWAEEEKLFYRSVNADSKKKKTSWIQLQNNTFQ